MGYPEFIGYAAQSGTAVLSALEANKTEIIAEVDDVIGKSAKAAYYHIATLVENTWYTVVDATIATGGVMSWVRGYCSTGARRVEIEITIDGVVNVIKPTDAALVTTIYGVANDANVIDSIGDIKFISTLKVRVRGATGATGALSAGVHYRSN